MKRLSIIVWSLLIAACVTVPVKPQPPIPPTPPPIDIFDATFPMQCSDIWWQELGQPPAPSDLADCMEKFRRGSTGEAIRQPVHDSPEGVAHRQAIEDAKKVKVFPALTTDGPIFLSGGQPWRWMGVSAFGLANKFRNGENIDGFLSDFAGYNVLRVWDYVPVADWKDTAWDSIPDETWLRFLAYVGNKGFLVELTLLTDDDPARLEPARRLVEALKSAHPTNLLLEAGNEPTTHKNINTAALRATLEASGFPYTSGDYEDSGRFYGSYGVFHSARDSEWPRRSHDALEYYGGGGPNAPTDPAHRVPWVADEPAKWQDVGAVPDDFRAYFGSCSLLCAGVTFHFEGGKFGTRPTDLERSLASIALDAMTAFPADAPKGPYSRPVDSSLRTYIVGGYAVRIRHTTSLKPFNGTALDPAGILWRLTGTFVHLR